MHITCQILITNSLKLQYSNKSLYLVFQRYHCLKDYIQNTNNIAVTLLIIVNPVTV